MRKNGLADFVWLLEEGLLCGNEPQWKTRWQMNCPEVAMKYAHLSSPKSRNTNLIAHLFTFNFLKKFSSHCFTYKTMRIVSKYWYNNFQIFTRILRFFRKLYFFHYQEIMCSYSSSRFKIFPSKLVKLSSPRNHNKILCSWPTVWVTEGILPFFNTKSVNSCIWFC